MIVPGFEDGVKVEDGDAQIFQVGQLQADALQVAAEEIARRVAAVLAVPVREGQGIPVLLHNHIIPVGLGQPGPVKAVGKDLVHDAAAKVPGRVIVRRVYRDLIGGRQVQVDGAFPAQAVARVAVEHAPAALVIRVKIVP